MGNRSITHKYTVVGVKFLSHIWLLDPQNRWSFNIGTGWCIWEADWFGVYHVGCLAGGAFGINSCGSRTGPRRKWHSPLTASCDPTGDPGVQGAPYWLKWPNSMCCCFHRSWMWPTWGQVISNEGLSALEADPQGLTAKVCLMTALPAAGTSP